MTIWPALLQVFGLLVLTAPSVSGLESNLNGPLCNFSINARCLFGATCVAPQQCACSQGTSVDGSFFCSDPAEQRIELTGFENSFQPWNTTLEAPFPFACRSRVTEFVVERPAEGRVCTFQIFGENKVLNQKVLVAAAEVHLKVEEFGQLRYEKAIRLTPGTLEDNSYQYLERTKNVYEEESAETYTELPDDSDLINSGSGMGGFLDGGDDEQGGNDGAGPGPMDDEDTSTQWSSPAQLAGTVTELDGLLTKQVDSNSVAIIGVEECGSEIRFRAADDELIDSGLRPGLAVVIDENINSVRFSNANSYIAGSPTSDVNSNIRRDFSLSQSEVLLHTSMAYSAVQGDGSEGEVCRDTAFVYRAYCDNLDKKMAALKKCAPLVTDEDTRSCLDATQSEHGGALQVFKQCMWVDCSPTFTVCNTLRSTLNTDTCLNDVTHSSLLANCPP